jgi:hypothetical protein
MRATMLAAALLVLVLPRAVAAQTTAERPAVDLTLYG